MRKLFVAFVTLSLVLWTVGAAFASFEDVEGTDYENAVTTLNGLGILKGYEDGTFKPDKPITRAEFAAVAVRALGLESAAGYSEGQTPFADVPATHWASGYINVAYQNGLLKGYEDGTFRPSNNVTYAESLAILVRALGYDPTVKGAWPTNYVIKASELGITADLTFFPNTPATRGDVALFTDESLTVPMLVQTGWGDMEQYVVDEDKTLLEDKLGVAAKEGRVVETGLVFGTTLDEDELMLDMGEDGTKTYSISEALDMSDTLGLEVTAWVDGSEIIAFEVDTDDADIIDDVIDGIAEDGTEITLDDADETYDVDAAAVWYYNFVEQSADDLDAIGEDDGDWVGAEVRVVLDDDEIVFVSALMFEPTHIVSEVRSKYEKLDTLDEGSSTGKTFDLDDDYDVVRLVSVDGAELTYDDIEEWNVIHFFEALGGDCLYMVVSDAIVEGEVEEIDVDSKDNIIVTIDGEEYTVAGGASYSTDLNDDDFGAVNEPSLADFIEADVTAYLDKDGDIQHIAGDVEAEPTEEITAMVLDLGGSSNPTTSGIGNDEYWVKLITSDGDKTWYEFDDDTVFTLYDDTNNASQSGDPDIDGEAMGDTGGPDFTVDIQTHLTPADVVVITLTDDGLLDTVEELDFTINNDTTVEGDIDADYDLIDLKGKNYRATSGTVIFDEYAENEDAMEWNVFEDASITGTDVTLDGVRACVDGSILDVLVINSSTVDDIAYAVSEDTGVIVKRLVTADGIAFDLLVEDDTTRYLLGDAVLTSLADDNWEETPKSDSEYDIDVGDLVSYTLTGDEEEFKTIDEELATVVDSTYYHVYVNEIDLDALELEVRTHEDPDEGTTETFLLTSDTIVYDVTDVPVMVDLEDIDEDYEVQIFETGFVVDYIKITDK